MKTQNFVAISRSLCALSLALGLSGCTLFGYGGKISPAQVEGTWSFRPLEASPCGIDSITVSFRDADRTWGAFFISGEANTHIEDSDSASGPYSITHGRVQVSNGNFLAVFSDAEAPAAREQFELDGSFQSKEDAVATFTRLLPDPDCSQVMHGASSY